MTKDSINSYFRQRKSVRKFKDNFPTQQQIHDILEAAMRAPTTGNMQLYSVIETRNPEKKKQLAKLHFNQPASVSAPLLLTFCADFYRFTRWCENNNADAGYDNFLSFANAMLDATIFAQQFATIAEQSGLGTVYLGTALYQAPEISKLLKLPKLTVPVACLAVGFPDEIPAPSERLNLNGILFEEEYPDLSNDDINDIYSIKDNYEPNRKFVLENNKQNLAQVFAEIRYPRSLNEPVSEKLIEFLKNQKFIQ